MGNSLQATLNHSYIQYECLKTIVSCVAIGLVVMFLPSLMEATAGGQQMLSLSCIKWFWIFHRLMISILVL